MNQYSNMVVDSFLGGIESMMGKLKNNNIRLSKDIIDKLNLEDGDEFDIQIISGNLLLIPVTNNENWNIEDVDEAINDLEKRNITPFGTAKELTRHLGLEQ